MAPTTFIEHANVLSRRDDEDSFGDWRDADTQPETYVVESWGEGFLVGALLIMACITIANMRKGVLLHKLILLELLLAMSHGTFCFMSFKGFGWYLSSTAALLYCSYFTHNVVAWLKIRPFFSGANASFGPAISRWTKRLYLWTLAATIPVLIFEVYNNFRFFNNISRLYTKVRPYEPLFRDPWWIFSCLVLFHVIRKVYSLNVLRLVHKSPRFGILLAAIFLAIGFTIVDIISSIVPGLSLTDGINPYWKLALVFKCLTDNIMLDDFKSVLQRLGAVKLDGTNNAMQDNSLNLSADEKLKVGGDEDETHHMENHYGGHRYSRSNRMSLSGRALDDGETIDEDGYTRRRQSILHSTVGKLGVKLSKLPALAPLTLTRSRAEREAHRNMKLNSRAGGSSGGSPAGSPKGSPRHIDIEEPAESSQSQETEKGKENEEQPPWEAMDFITALNDPEMNDASRATRKR